MEKGEQIITKTVNFSNVDNYFDFESKEDQLFEKITPMESVFCERLFEDEGFRTPSNWNSNQYFLL